MFLARFHSALLVYYNQFINLATLTSEFTSSFKSFEPEAPVFQAYISLMSSNTIKTTRKQLNKRVSFLPFGLLSLIAKHSSLFFQMAIPISLNKDTLVKFCLDFNAENSTINKIKAALLYSIICLTIWMA